MKQVLLSYNPDKVKTQILVDNEEPKKNSSIVKYLNKPFQSWVDKIPKLLETEYNDDEFKITFHGTDLDYQNLLVAVEYAKKNGLNFSTKKLDAKEFGEKEKDIRNLFSKNQQRPFEELQSLAVANASELDFNERLEVDVVGTMCAGKSTLINALLGKELIPSKQVTGTATITRIQDDDDSTFKAVAFDEFKYELEHFSVLDYKTMMALNKNEKVSEIEVKGNIPFVTSEEVSLVLIDTPGPDNARNKRHGMVTAKALDQSSKMLVMFVMNGGKLHDEAQDDFLKRIAKSMSVDGKQSKERFLFVINKMDGYDEEDDDIAGETILGTIKYLEEMGIEDPNIFPVAAEPALLIRRYWSTTDEEEKKTLYDKAEAVAKKLINQKQLHLEQYAHLSGSCQDEIDAELQKAIEEGDILKQALIHSGIRGIEETIKMYVTKYCRPAKITNVVNTFESGLESAEVFTSINKEITKGEQQMKQVLLSHNPYKVKTQILVDNEEPKKNSPIVQYLNKRFQLWVDQIPKLLETEYNDDEFEITFHGTDLDYQDLLVAVEYAKKNGLKFSTKKLDAKEFGEKEKDIRNLFSKIQKLPFEELQSPAVANAFELAFNELLEVNVVATMSAGKSTLINALLGKKLMPSKQGACTATITRIQDDDDSTFKAVAFDEFKYELEHFSVLDYKTMMALNKNEKVSEIEVKGNIPFVTSEEVSLVLIDTPGPDNARNKRHGMVTAKALDQSSKMLVMFVMNGGKLHDEAQDDFLKRIAKSMSVDGKQSKERFLFVINKMDGYDEEDDDIAGETILGTIKYLEEMGIEDPNIFPVAAEPALLIRRYWSTTDEEEKKTLYDKAEAVAKKLINQKQLHLEQYAHLSGSCQDEIDAELQKAIEEGDILKQALIHSGIRGIEETIKMYVTKYCRPAKITNVVNTFESGLESAEAFTSTKKEIASRQDEITAISVQMESLEKKLASRKDNEEFKKKLRSLNIKTKLVDEVDKLIQDVEANLTKFFGSCESEMDEDKATKYIRNFRKLACDKQNEFYVAVDRLLDEDIREKSSKLLQEYTKKLEALSEEFSGQGLKLDLKDYAKGSLAQLKGENSILDNSLDKRIESHTETRTRTVTETRRRRGWDRFSHPSSWFDPTYTVEVEEAYDVEVKEEVTFISRDKLINQMIPPIRTKLYEERTRILQYADDETERVTEYFEVQFDAVDDILAKKAKELRLVASSKDESEKALKEATKLLERLTEIKKELNAILEI